MDQALLDKLHAATDATAGETVGVQNVVGGAYLDNEGPLGPAGEVTAYFSSVPSQIRTAGNAANSGHNIELRGATIAAKFATSALSFTVETDALVTRLTQPGAPAFRVVSVLPFGTDRTLLLLAPA